MFVGNLSFSVTREELIEAFSAAGRVVDAKVPLDRETGRPRGFAFVEFEDEQSAERSIQMMNGRDLKGRPLRVNDAENRPPRSAGGSEGRPRGSRFGPPPDVFLNDRGFPARRKGSRRNIRRRKRGFD